MLIPNVDLKNKTVLVTGAAGFIGANLCKVLLNTVKGIRVIGVDNMNDYYDVSIKDYRLAEIEKLASESDGEFVFIKGNIADRALIDGIFDEHHPAVVVNLAAQAGVRYSITNPDVYIEANIIGFYHILEACRRCPVEHLVYASSSSVYGSNKKVPYSTDDKVDNPVSLYAATKKSNELMAYTYSHLYKIPTTGLRFFTVYGPFGRPDMAYFGFTNKIMRGETIQIFNNGDMKRDFTYVDDIVTGIEAMLCNPPEGKDPARVYNIGNNQPEDLLRFVETLEKCLMDAGLITEPAKKEFLPMQPGDVYQTYADIAPLERDFGFRPSMPIEEGLARFARWYADFYRKN